MTQLQQTTLSVVAIIIAGICWFLSIGLHGNWWYLLWIAPVPVLITAVTSSAKKTFTIAFTAYLIGRLSWLSYLIAVMTTVPAIIATVLLALAFAGIILAARAVFVRTHAWYAVFAFPVFHTAFELLLYYFSPDGSAASVAYSQADFLPLVQLASVTGIAGITFIVTLIPSALALSWFFYQQHRKAAFIKAGFVSAILVAGALLYGAIRLRFPLSSETAIPVGMVVLDEKLHDIDHPDFEKAKTVAALYAQEIANLANAGARVIVLPEKAINLNGANDTAITNIFAKAAKQNYTYIIAGCADYRKTPAYNNALVFNNEGAIINSYNKLHLIKGLEDRFAAGRQPGLFSYMYIPVGTAICKDLDFPNTISEYGDKHVSLLFVPAWDFIKDDWLHSRMAILRGVENGFAEVRAARQGSLTISDCYGHVLAEASCTDNKKATLKGLAPAMHVNTPYTRYGNWVVVVIALSAIALTLACFSKKIKR